MCESLGGVWNHPLDQASEDSDYSCFHPESIVIGHVIQDFKNGTYLLEYTPRYAGSNELDIKLNGTHIFESPFTVEVMDGATKGNNSTASGKGLHHAIAGITDYFTVQAKDEYDNLKTISGDNFVVTMTYNPSGPHIANNRPNGSFIFNGTSKYIGNGRYECKYNVTISGDYFLDVTLNGKHIHGSPFTPYVEPNVANPAITIVTAYLSAPGDDEIVHIDSTTWPAPYTSTWNGLLGGTAGYLSPFSIQAKDVYGNNRTAQQSYDTFVVSLEGLSPNAGNSDLREAPAGLTTEAVYMGYDGQYNGSYFPLNAGQYKLHVTLNGNHVHDSPYSVTITPDLSNGPNCSAIGPGLVSATSDVETEFTIQARDVFGNPQIHGNDEFYVNAIRQPIDSDAPQFNQTDIAHIYETHGQYRVRYTPKASGLYILRVALIPPVGRHIATSRDVKAHPFLDPSMGPRAVAESIASEEIKGSPFVVYVNDGAVDARTSTAWGIGLSHSTAGEYALFYVQARDKALNNRSSGGDTVSFTATNTENEFHGYNVSGEMTEYNADGVIATRPVGEVRYIGRGLYRCMYNATKRGNYSIAVKIGGEHIVGSPFLSYTSPSYADARHSYVGGPGTESANGLANLDLDAIVPSKSAMGTSNFTVIAKDRFGNQLDRGGDQFMVRLDGPTNILAVMKDLGKGMYRSEYIVPFNGTYRLSVALLEGYLTSTGGGLRGEYFKRHDLSSNPDYTRLDSTVDVELGLEVAAVRWRGLIVPPRNGLWAFVLDVGGTGSLGGNALLLLNGKTVFHGNVQSGNMINGTLPMIGAIPYNITLEWLRHGEGTRTLAFKWLGPTNVITDSGSEGVTSKNINPSSPKIPSIVPTTRLAERATHLTGSPIILNNTDQPPGSEY